MKPNLVIMPSGPDAVFQQWGNLDNYNFDLAVLNWHGGALENLSSAKYVVNIPGHKWRIIHQFDQTHDLSEYEYIWCLDDDCITTPDLIDLTFAFCKERNIDLGQPALTPDSFHSHPPTIMIPDATMHITTTVEIMCPIFRRRIWKECIAPCAAMPGGIGYGLESWFTNAAGCMSGRSKYGGLCAIIDRFPVYHSKPVTTVQQWQARGLSPDQDGEFFAKMGLPFVFRTLEVIND